MTFLEELKSNTLDYFTQDEAKKLEDLREAFKNDPTLSESMKLGCEFMNIFTNPYISSCRRSVGSEFLLEFNFNFADSNPIDGLVNVLTREQEDRNERDDAIKILLRIISNGQAFLIDSVIRFKIEKLQKLSEIWHALDEL